jgi:hypothetical protein
VEIRVGSSVSEAASVLLVVVLRDVPNTPVEGKLWLIIIGSLKRPLVDAGVGL